MPLYGVLAGAYFPRWWRSRCWVRAGFVLSAVTLAATPGGGIFDQYGSGAGMRLASLAISLGAASIALAFTRRSTAHAHAPPW